MKKPHPMQRMVALNVYLDMGKYPRNRRENSDESRSQWSWATWNPYIGCRKVSPGCAHCYMFRDQERYGLDPTRVRRTSDKTFYAPLRWKQPHVIFTASWSDFFIEEGDAWREDVWEVIRSTPQHIYQVLTKRPERMRECLPPDWGDGWPHVWLGVTAENQRAADKRIPLLLETPAAIRWTCAEPLLGPVDLSPYLSVRWNGKSPSPYPPQAITGEAAHLDWVITGAESGPQARPMEEDWVRTLRDQCVATAVPFWYKQKVVGGHRINSPRLDGETWEQMPILPAPVLPEQVSAKPRGVQLTMFD